MDCGEIYIKMCEEAVEIQSKRIHIWLGDFYQNGKEYLPEAFICCKVIWYKEKEVWLPQQDQLQEMIPLKSKFHRIVDKLYDFTEWIKINAAQASSECSMEQLWLGFVMSELYKKQWDFNKEKWVERS